MAMIIIVLLMAEIRLTTWYVKTLQNLQIMGEATYQLVQDFSHQQYYCHHFDYHFYYWSIYIYSSHPYRHDKPDSLLIALRKKTHNFPDVRSLPASCLSLSIRSLLRIAVCSCWLLNSGTDPHWKGRIGEPGPQGKENICTIASVFPNIDRERLKKQ